MFLVNDVLDVCLLVNPLVGSLTPQSNGPLYSNTVIGTLAVDEWAVTFGTARIGLGRLQPKFSTQSPPRCTKCNSPPINRQCTYHLHIIRCGTSFALDRVNCVDWCTGLLLVAVHPTAFDLTYNASLIIVSCHVGL